MTTMNHENHKVNNPPFATSTEAVTSGPSTPSQVWCGSDDWVV